MGFFDLFKKKPLSHEEKVDRAYRCYKPEAAEVFFPEGRPHADRVIRSLALLLAIDLASSSPEVYYRLLSIYTDTVIRASLSNGDGDATVAYLLRKHSALIKSERVAHWVFAYTRLNIVNHGFTLNNAADISLLSEFDTLDQPAPPDPEPVSDPSAPNGFYFETTAELSVYGKLYGGQRTIYWLSGSKYTDLLQKGYALYERGRYRDAIDVLNDSLTLNPIGLSARFEIIECHIRLRNLPAARAALYAMTDYLVEATTIARFYRRLGYISTEEGQHLCAAACYAYSQSMEDHPSIRSELLYIRSHYEFDVSAVLADPVPILRQFQIPVLAVPAAEP